MCGGLPGTLGLINFRGTYLEIVNPMYVNSLELGVPATRLKRELRNTLETGLQNPRCLTCFLVLILATSHNHLLVVYCESVTI